ncbi:MAG: STAS domain-containing protein [Deltaproteobacteria bacterium]|nr:STAS domain-containing protein [Deltaproteobacteria bacterium]
MADPEPSVAKPRHPVFLPKIFSTLKTYSLDIFWGDLSGGVIVGVVALPLAIAFAIASGVTPDRGLTTAIVAGFLISAFGGSRVQIGGPTGAFVVIVYNIVEKYGVDGLIICTVMAGVMLVLMGVARLGVILKYIPYQLTVGFTAGIAMVIFSSEVKDFLGLRTGPVPADFIDKWAVYLQNIGTLHLPTVGLSILSILIIVLWPRVSRRVPGPIAALLIVTAIVNFFNIPVETIGSRFGSIPSGLPAPSLPHVTLDTIKMLLPSALTVALLGAIESLLSAVVADGMIESKHRSNTELIGQGIANIITPFFGGIPSTGAIARTATNVKNGGKTPVAGIIHAVTLLVIMLIFGRWATLIPLCVLAAILVVVSYHMSEWRAFKSLLSAPRMDIAVLIVTFVLTVFADLTIAIEVGVLMSAVLFMKRMTDVTVIRNITSELDERVDEEALREDPGSISRRKVPDGVAVYEAEGALFFGVAESIRDTISIGKNPPRVLILRTRHVLALDATAIRALGDLKRQCDRYRTRLVISGIHAQPMIAMERSGLLYQIGQDNVCATIDDALARAREIAGGG